MGFAALLVLLGMADEAMLTTPSPPPPSTVAAPAPKTLYEGGLSRAEIQREVAGAMEAIKGC
jgi:hypothetical protein